MARAHKATRGLVIGKFYPPHCGHRFLIDTARANVDELTVIVCDRPEQVPRGALRAAWLREIHPNVHVMVIADTLDPDDSQAWAEHSVQWLGYVPDVVFTSEAYGARFAACLGCAHQLVDIQRGNVPISGTRVRADPLACWDYLEPPVRGYYAKRICLVGAESTGKTTLAQALAEHFNTAWVPEYGREYSEQKLAVDGEYHWTSDEFAHIARTQCQMEDAAARQANRVLVCDTDAFATGIWHERYMGRRSPEVDAVIAEYRCPDLYLLTDVDTPFVQDGTRDGEMIREWMHTAFERELRAWGRPFRVLRGTYEERTAEAMEAMTEILDRGLPQTGQATP